MECNLNDTFKVIIGNIKMKYQVFPIVYHCPNWIDQITNNKKLTLDGQLDINGVRDFFDGLQRNSVHITPDNCKTILDLAKLSGAQKIMENATNIFNENQKTIPEVAEELIKNAQNGNIDSHCDEVFLAKHYNELLMYPQLLKNIDIANHYRILKLAIQNDKENFNLHQFLDFLIDSMQSDDKNKKFSVLLSLFNPIEFNEDEIIRLSKCKNYDDSFTKYRSSDFLTIIEQNNKQILKQDEIIQKLQSNQEQMINQFNELQKSNKEIKEQIQAILNFQSTNLIEKINENNQNISSVEDNLKKEVNNCNEQIKKQEENVTKIINAQIKSIDEIKQQNINLCGKIDVNNQNINDFKCEIGKNVVVCQDKIKKQINDMSESISTQFKSFDDVKLKTTSLIQNNEACNQSVKDLKSELKQDITNSQVEIQNQYKNLTNLIQVQQGSVNEIKQQTQEIKIMKEEMENYHMPKGLIISKEYENNRFSGILSELVKLNKYNINDNGLIKITGKGTGGGTGSLSSLIDYNSNSMYLISDLNKSPMICFDFKNYSICISAYSVKTSSRYYMRSWVVEGSNDDSNWTILDSHSNNTTMNSSNTAYTFIINESNIFKLPLRYIRFRLTGENSVGEYAIEVCNIEFFGKLYKS